MSKNKNKPFVKPVAVVSSELAASEPVASELAAPEPVVNSLNTLIKESNVLDIGLAGLAINYDVTISSTIPEIDRPDEDIEDEAKLKEENADLRGIISQMSVQLEQQQSRGNMTKTLEDQIKTLKDQVFDLKDQLKDFKLFREQLKLIQQQQQELKGNTMTPEQFDNFDKIIKQQQQDINQLKSKGNNMTPEQIEKFLTLINDLSTHVKSLNTTSQENSQEVETLKQQLEAATSRNTGIQQELDNAVKEKAELTKWNSRHNLKVAGAVVGAIVIIAGVAYVVRRLLSNGEAEVEAVEVTPELSVVNY